MADVADFDFDLPEQLIAQEPPAERGASRLMVVDRASGRIDHRQFAELPSLLRAGDLLVVNDTRVFPARLIGVRLPGGGAAECFLVRPADAPDTWIALVHPGQRLREGARMEFKGAKGAMGAMGAKGAKGAMGAKGATGAMGATDATGPVLHAEVVGRHFHGRRTVRLWTEDGSSVRDTIEAIGHVPLPPYIKRPDQAADRDRYQTVYARERGSIAAPTAGLHFTPALLEALERRGVERAGITLHVGYGTFQPIRVDVVEEHRMEPEHYEVTVGTAAQLSRARREGRRIIAVGTTSTRTLESLTLLPGGDVMPGTGETSLFIHPGHEFRLVSGLITNFHLPRSSLLMLVSAFGGRDAVMAAYREAIARRYRFYSYGDAMLIV